MPKAESLEGLIQLQVAPVVLGWSANVKINKWELLDYESEIAVTDAYDIGSLKIKLD